MGGFFPEGEGACLTLRLHQLGGEGRVGGTKAFAASGVFAHFPVGKERKEARNAVSVDSDGCWTGFAFVEKYFSSS